MTISDAAIKTYLQGINDPNLDPKLKVEAATKLAVTLSMISVPVNKPDEQLSDKEKEAAVGALAEYVVIIGNALGSLIARMAHINANCCITHEMIEADRMAYALGPVIAEAAQDVVALSTQIKHALADNKAKEVIDKAKGCNLGNKD